MQKGGNNPAKPRHESYFCAKIPIPAAVQESSGWFNPVSSGWFNPVSEISKMVFSLYKTLNLYITSSIS
jgi:hypothetical protein